MSFYFYYFRTCLSGYEGDHVCRSHRFCNNSFALPGSRRKRHPEERDPRLPQRPRIAPIQAERSSELVAAQDRGHQLNWPNLHYGSTNAEP